MGICSLYLLRRIAGNIRSLGAVRLLCLLQRLIHGWISSGTVIVPYAIARRSAAAYYRENTVLVPFRSVAAKSNQPASQCIRIALTPADGVGALHFPRQISFATWVELCRVFPDKRYVTATATWIQVACLQQWGCS